MTHQGMCRIFRYCNKICFILLIFSSDYGILLLFAGCENVQQLLVPVPVGDDDSTIRIGFVYTSDTRSNSLNGAE